LPVLPVYAITYTINSIEAYRHIVEPNDQLYLIKYTDSEVADNLTFTLYSANLTVLGSTTPYIYHTQGVAVIYFSATNAPTWNGAYSVNMTGSSVTSSSTFSSWSTSTTQYDTSVALTSRILTLAGQFSTIWSDNLTQTIDGKTTLTASGINYFANTFPNLKNVCPALYNTNISQPILQIKTQNITAASVSDSRLINTKFDTTGIANFLGVSRMWSNALVWVLFWLALDAALVWKMKATRIALFVFGFAMIGGSITGFMGMLAGAMVGILGGLSIVYAFMWKQAS
jgi:hypothetical protein